MRQKPGTRRGPRREGHQRHPACHAQTEFRRHPWPSIAPPFTDLILFAVMLPGIMAGGTIWIMANLFARMV